MASGVRKSVGLATIGALVLPCLTLSDRERSSNWKGLELEWVDSMSVDERRGGLGGGLEVESSIALACRAELLGGTGGGTWGACGADASEVVSRKGFDACRRDD